MTIELAWATAESIASGLDQAHARIDDTAGTAPTDVDAGEVSALVSAMLSRVTESAAGVSEGLSAASGKVTSAAASLLNADVAARDDFRLAPRGSEDPR